jgi:hypothetical protein
MPELTITSPYVHLRVDFSTFTRVELTLCHAESALSPSQGLWMWPLIGSTGGSGEFAESTGRDWRRSPSSLPTPTGGQRAEDSLLQN